ncbi:MAG: APC family permease [Alphaproteobacteria bacterium]|nr:APC family permease [Alphaproteobacteria bacterium]
MHSKLPQKNIQSKTPYFQRSLVDNHPLAKIRQFLFGHPLKTSHQKKERVGFLLGLPILAVDTISSLAYATEEILIALSLGGMQFLQLSLPIAIIIILLLWTLVISYSQTVQAYPEGGGAYIVAKHNIGPFVSLLGASALILDYILTVAVSVTAGIRALTSAYPQLFPYATELSIIGILILGWLNLRGIRESAHVILIPVYAFVLMVFVIGVSGLFVSPADVKLMAPTQENNLIWSILTIFIVLRAFAGGCTAMTGIEAVANAGRILKEPTSRIAQRILIAIGLIGAGSFFLITKVASNLGLVPMQTESIISQLSRNVLGEGFFYTFFQFLTAIILFLAANTSFAGFPQLAAMVAKDQWLPKQLSAIGDRLVFSYGITFLTLISCLLVIIFKGNTHALIPLYAIGVFSAFTLNQIGMTHFWFKAYKEEKLKNSHVFSLKSLFSHPHTKMFINAFGATFTALALVITSTTKFVEGGFIIFLAIPGMVTVCYVIRNHYDVIEKELLVTPKVKKKDIRHRFSQSTYRTVVVPVSRLHRGSYEALAFAREITQNVIALIVEVDADAVENTRKQLQELNWDLKIIILNSPYRSIIRPIVKYVLHLDRANNQLVTIVLPEIVPAKWWQNSLHNSTANAIAKVLSWSEDIPNQARIIINVPFHVKK